MESKAVGFCAVVVILGIIATAAAFAAEATRIKASEIYVYTTFCELPSSPALALGIISAVFAIITQVYITITFGGCRCCRNDPNSTPISKLLSVLSWVATVIAVILLFAAAGITNSCNVLKPGIFATGGILALLSAVFAIAAFITVTPTPQTNTNPIIANPIGPNVDPEKNNLGPYATPQQFPPQQYHQNHV